MAVGFLCFPLLSYPSVTLLLKTSPLLCPIFQPSSREILREEKPWREGNYQRKCCSVSEEDIAWLESEERRRKGNLETSRHIWRTVQDLLFKYHLHFLSHINGSNLLITESPSQLKCFFPQLFHCGIVHPVQKRNFYPSLRSMSYTE